jgi:hypothetical protein
MSIASRNPNEPISDEQWDEIRARWPHAERISVAKSRKGVRWMVWPCGQDSG